MEPDLSFLQCYICYEWLKKPKMCPSCSKVACEKCLRSWVEDHRQECPHCRKPMPFHNFAQCQRFINDIKSLFLQLDKSERRREKCFEHSLEMQYYCENCNVAICSDCGMFGTKHRNHQIIHLKKIYETHKTKILNELSRFDQKIQKYRKNGYQIRLEMQKLHLHMEQKKNFIEEYFIVVLERLKEEFKQKEEVITKKYDKNIKQIQFLESVRENLCQDLEGHSENQLIKKCQQFLTYIQVLCHKDPESDEESYGFDTINEIVPRYNEFDYVLENYQQLDDGLVYSDPYTINGIQWRLKIYPRGNGAAKETHMSVFLEMSKGYVNQKKYEYKIQLINKNSSMESISRQYSSNFDIGECWGYNQFVSLFQVENDFLTEEGSLLFHVSVRNPSYRSLVADKENYILHLQSKMGNDNKKQNEEKSIKSKQVINLEEGAKKKSGVHKIFKENQFEMLEDESDMINERKFSNSLIEILNQVGEEIGKGEKVRKSMEQSKFQLEEENE